MKKLKSLFLILIIFIIAVVVFFYVSGINFPGSGDTNSLRSALDVPDQSISSRSQASSQSDVLPDNFAGYNSTVVEAPKGSLNVYLADTDERMELGLGKRKSIPQTSGMLFGFKDPATYGF